MIAAIVTVLINGQIVEGSTPAKLRRNVVVAPLWPYLDRIAQRVERDPSGDAFVFERAGRTFRIVVGSPLARTGDATQLLVIAPYLRAGETIIPLAAVARALGGSVAYDPLTRTLQIDLAPEPLATMTPYASWSPPPGPLATFTPTPTPAPSETVSPIPFPRRTPILIERAKKE